MKNYFKLVLGFTTKICLFGFILTSHLRAENRPYQEVLSQLFPGCKKTKENIFLTKEQKKDIESAINHKLYSPMGLRYAIECSKGHSYAYVDSHLVRTMNETVVIEINDESKIAQYRISSFMEPSEYRPPEQWIKQVINKGPQDEYQLNHEIDALSGATLSANAIVKSSKRIIKLHQVLNKE